MNGPRLHGRPRNLVILYQRRSSTAIHVYCGADRWADALVLKAMCSARPDVQSAWIDVNQSTADARAAYSLTKTERC